MWFSVITVEDSNAMRLFQPALEAIELEDTWFQQNGATAHTARVTMLPG